MGEALDAGLDLGGLAGCYVAIGLISILLMLLAGLDKVLNFSILGTHPLGGVAKAIENTLVAGLNDAVHFLEAQAAAFESGLVDSLALLIAIPILIVEGVYKALQYGLDQVIMPLINQVAAAIAALSTKVAAQIATLTSRVEHVVAQAASYTDAKIADAAGALAGYADVVAHNAELAAERYASQAVEALRSAEEAAVSHAVGLANEAKAAGEAAAAGVLATARAGIADAEALAMQGITTAEQAAAAGVDTAERFASAAANAALGEAEAAAAGALAAADAAGKAALSVVAGVADAAEQGVLDLEHLIESSGWVALIASIPALAILVNAIATEAGLGNASCRSKVGNICQTDPLAWANLLGGLAAVGFAFSLRDLYDVAEGLVGELAGVIEQAA